MSPGMVIHSSDPVGRAGDDECGSSNVIERTTWLPRSEGNRCLYFLTVFVRRDQSATSAHGVAHDCHFPGIDPAHQRTAVPAVLSLEGSYGCNQCICP